jgi:hypothetical protein
LPFLRRLSPRCKPRPTRAQSIRSFCDADHNSRSCCQHVRRSFPAPWRQCESRRLPNQLSLRRVEGFAIVKHGANHAAQIHGEYRAPARAKYVGGFAGLSGRRHAQYPDPRPLPPCWPASPAKAMLPAIESATAAVAISLKDIRLSSLERLDDHLSRRGRAPFCNLLYGRRLPMIESLIRRAMRRSAGSAGRSAASLSNKAAASRGSRTITR